MTSERWLANLLAVGGALLAVISLQRSWGSGLIARAAPLPSDVVHVAGHQLAPGTRTLAVVVIAAAVAAYAAPHPVRPVVGLVLLLCGAGIAWQAVDSGTVEAIRAQLTTARDPASVTHVARSGWHWLAVIGGVLAAGSGLLVLVRGRRWVGMSESYRAPADRKPDPVTDKGVWDALDRGEDPTA